MAATTEPLRFAFIFPMASGHINPSLGISRSLVNLGHEVHYLCREQMREAIEGTGAVFHSDVEQLTELYEGRQPDISGAIESLKEEYGMADHQGFTPHFKLRCVQLQMKIPGVVRFLRDLQPSAVVYCPLINREAALGAKVVGVPCVSLLTTAGPGSLVRAMDEFLKMEGKPVDEIIDAIQSFEPHKQAMKAIAADTGVELMAPEVMLKELLGYLDCFAWSELNLVTTTEQLQDPVPPAIADRYKAEKASFEFVGPLLDQEGAKRASVHKLDHDVTKETTQDDAEDLLERVAAAKAAGRRVVLASMGTVITGDHPQVGWDGRLPSPGSEPMGLTGRELCQAAWGGAFDAFGAASAEQGPLIVVALGPQHDPLGDLQTPPNAICMPSVPQVDTLRRGVDIFLTHGGQNSFTEGMAHGVPVVVCPGFGDQITNSKKAEELGNGLKVDRPKPALGDEAAAAASYRADVLAALLRTATEPSFRDTAAALEEGLRKAGGVPRATELLISIARKSAVSASMAAQSLPVASGLELAGKAGA